MSRIVLYPGHLVCLIICLILCSLPFSLHAQEDEPISTPPSPVETMEAETVLSNSIAYHDPQNRWDSFQKTMTIIELRPKDGSAHPVTVTLDRVNGRFVLEETDGGKKVYKAVTPEGCTATLDGSDTFSNDDAKSYRMSCDEIKRYRGYYLYMYGIPMKLRDAGTRIDSLAERTTFINDDAWAIRVTYDEAVGSDIWYFYFDPETYRLIGCRFFHDEAKQDGEFIIYQGEHMLDEIRTAKRRRWYMNKDNQFLGTDLLQKHTDAGEK